MTPAEIKSLRTELKCSTRALAEAIGTEQEHILSWERGDTFPTKRWVDRMAALRVTGLAAPNTTPRSSAVVQTGAKPFQGLADPKVWEIMRKVVAYPELRARVEALTETYDEPSDPS